MTKTEAKLRINIYCPPEFQNSREVWAIEDFIDYLYDTANCEIVDRTVEEDEVA